MAKEGSHIGGNSSGLAVILNGEDSRECSQNTHLFSNCYDIGKQSVERTLEHIFDLPFRSIGHLSFPVDISLARSIIKNDFSRLHVIADSPLVTRDGVCVIDNGYGSTEISIEKTSICGDIRILKPPLLIESLSMFSSARANASVWAGKWMYEAILETSGIQQLGWATITCPFTDQKGVGDAEDSYAFDGRRVSKWNQESEAYGQPWVVGDVIGCCIDLDCGEIKFYRNGVSLGIAFFGIRKMGPGIGYSPAISLSQGERCELNFGGHPFIYPVEGFLPLQAPPSLNSIASQLLKCLSRLLEIQCREKGELSSVEKLRRLKRFFPLEELFYPLSHAICKEFFSIVHTEKATAEYIGCGSLLSFLMEVFRPQIPHDYATLDKVIDLFLKFEGSDMMFEHVLNALSCSCKTAPLVLTNCPYSGSYSYVTLACHILRREELMILWWRSSHFELLFEGFLARKGPNNKDLEFIIPSVWLPGLYDGTSYENSMGLATNALSETVRKIEEKHRDLCCLIIQFIPPTSPPQFPGSVFRTLLQNLLFKNIGADRNMPPPGVSMNSVLVSLYTVILHFLSEGFTMGSICSCMKLPVPTGGSGPGFLHRGGQQCFPIDLFLKNDPLRIDISRLGGSFSHLLNLYPVNDPKVDVVRWEEGCMDDEEARVTHSTRHKPCCCANTDADFRRISNGTINYAPKGFQAYCSPVPERSARVAEECSSGSLSDAMIDKPGTSQQSETEFHYRPVQYVGFVSRETSFSSETLQEEELLDAMLLLYHMGVAPNFKQASHYMSHQSHLISLLEETDKHIRGVCGDQLKSLKEARVIYREEIVDCIRHCEWYRIFLISRWKQRGMYGTCMWVVQLLTMLSKTDLIFMYIPEYYVATLVDCFHVLRKSDPPFVPSNMLLHHGLVSFVTFVVTHFNDPRISSADIKDLLLQSISVLVQYKDFLTALEVNKAATSRMPGALLSEFGNRTWIPITNIILRLSKGFGFGSSKHGESSSFSDVFQRLLREACISDEELFSAFLNRLFNTLSRTITEFSVSIREMQEKYKVLEFHQRKCSVIFDLSCNLVRLLEFCTREIPQAFLCGADMNLHRLIELIVFILNHITTTTDTDFFDLPIRRTGQAPEKVNQGMILAPVVGIILNLLDASALTQHGEPNDVVGVFASMDCPLTIHSGFQYLLEYNWAGSFRGDACFGGLRKLEDFLCVLISRSMSGQKRIGCCDEEDNEDDACCICYSRKADTRFDPCSHRSCSACVTRHLLNCRRCFFCNTMILKVVWTDKESLSKKGFV